MTDINKQIEEEAREYLKSKNIACFPVPRKYLREGFIDGYNACLHSSRWRNVSEGLPEDSGWYLVRFENKNYRPEVVRFNSEFGWVRMFAENISEWKPID